MKIFVLIPCLIFFFCENSSHPKAGAALPATKPKLYDSHSLLIDPSNIPDTLLSPVVELEKRQKLQKRFEGAVANLTITKSNWLSFAPVIFYYRDKRVAPIFRQIIADSSAHLFFRALSVYSLGECGFHKDFSFLLPHMQNRNDLFREYVASALIKLADSADMESVVALTRDEQNGYIRKTLQAQVVTGASPVDRSLVWEPSHFKKVAFYPSLWLSDKKFQTVVDSAIRIPPVPVASDCIFPHQQYNVNPLLLHMIEYPEKSFGMEDTSWGIHVGEDSGWLFPGLSVHAIMDGVVVRILHSTSWGCLVVLGSKLPDSSLVTFYYGHLSHRINVRPGEIIKMGDKIGEVALSFTLANGGYLAHVHLGIEKRGIRTALIKGWYTTSDNWYDPTAFLSNFPNKSRVF